MGCCCFNTLRGAAFFVSSIQIYNGLECILKFILFPMVFSSMHDSKDPAEGTSFISFMPGMVYSILYFLLGCMIFRGIEQECARTVKWGSIFFAITEVCFFILRQVFKVTPTPKVAHLGPDEQPFEMNIYKTLYYFLFTIVGGLIYVCILFLYLQQLSKGQDEFAQFFNITARAPWSAPTPTTTTAAPQPPSASEPHLATGRGGPQPPINSNNNNSALQSNQNAQQQQQQQQQGQQRSSSSKHGHKSHERGHERSQKHGGGEEGLAPPPRKSRHASNININPIEGGGGPQQTMSPAPPSCPQGMEMGMGKDPHGPQSPSSPMFPYFLMRRSSKLNGQQQQGPPPPQHMGQRCLLDEPPPQSGVWQHSRGPPPMPPLRGDFGGLDGGGTPPRSVGSDMSGLPPVGIGRNLLSPSRLVNHSHGHGHGHGGPMPPPPHQFGQQPLIPPFYPDSPVGVEDSVRRESFGPPLGSPGGRGYYTSGRGPPPPESHYQKIPMSPGFDYCLR